MASTRIRVVYVDTDTEVELIMTMGDMVRATDWEKKQRVQGDGQDSMLVGLHAAFLSAKRQNLPHTGGDFLDWADYVTTVDDDDDEAQETGAEDGAGEPGESQARPLA